MSTDKDCIFCKIVAGEVPSYSVFENDDVYAFLDIHPASRGHTLVIPKIHQDQLDDLPQDIYRKVDDAAYEITKQLKQVFQPIRIGRAVIGIDVPHAHIHLVPLYEGGEIHITQDMDAQPDHTNLSVVANRLKIGQLPSDS
jgi:histidine triad (HIT) family protein